MRYLLLSRYLLIVFFGVRSICSIAQTDNAGSGRAIQFDGVDDYIDFGSVYHDLNLPFTISAWVYLDPTSGASPIFTTNDNDQTYRGFWFFISPSALWCEFGDGTGGNNPAFRRGKQAIISNVTGRWLNVSAVMSAPFDITLYVNGIDVGGFSTGSSGLTMASSFPGDIVKSGYFEANGGVTYKYKGMIDEMRLWNRSLTKTEVQQNMCKKLTVTQPGLIGYWSFDETSGTAVRDKSVKAYSGQLKNNPTRVFSGAPIGDDNKYQYSANWAGSTLSFQGISDLITVNNIMGSPEGVYIYQVSYLPSQTTGLTTSALTQPYYGVFAASLHTSNSFTISYQHQNTSCSMFSRSDNSIPNWSVITNPSQPISERAEIIGTSGTAINFDLGANQVICNESSATLSTGISDAQASFLWSTGQTTPSINITQPGKYWVAVKKDCSVSSDTITFSQVKQKVNFLPNAITPNGDDKNQFFKVDESISGSVSLLVLNRWGKEVYKSSSYENDWDGGGLDSGVYYIILKGSCIDETRDWLTIIR